jgi:hypothetical protein
VYHRRGARDGARNSCEVVSGRYLFKPHGPPQCGYIFRLAKTDLDSKQATGGKERRALRCEATVEMQRVLMNPQSDSRLIVADLRFEQRDV